MLCAPGKKSPHHAGKDHYNRLLAISDDIQSFKKETGLIPFLHYQAYMYTVLLPPEPDEALPYEAEVTARLFELERS